MSCASIMLVTYNRLDLTKRMMNSLFTNTTYPYKLIIVDNGSEDGTQDWLKSWKKNNLPSSCIDHEFLFNSKNLGIAIGRNQCLTIANKFNDEWLCTLDNDIELPDSWLQDCINTIFSNYNFAIGINMEDVKYPIIIQNGKKIQYKKEGNLGTACTVFNRNLHKKIGYFNTEYGPYGEEDADFFFRARMAGYQLGYLPEMGIHFGKGELDQGEYREFKNKCHAANLNKFRQNCKDYYNRKKDLYLPFKIEDIENII